MKRKYGAALARESEAEKGQRLRAKEMADNSNNYGSSSRWARFRAARSAARPTAPAPGSSHQT